MKYFSLKRMDWLDALRGVAIIMVIIVHANQLSPILNKIINNLAHEGMRGVQLFFVISGFTVLMTYEKGRATSAFMIKRFFRIAPLYFLFTVFWYLYGFGTKTYFAPNGFGTLELFETLTFINIWNITSYNAILPGGWSISAEMNMYLFVPILSSILINIRRGFTLLALSVILGIIFSIGGYMLFRKHPFPELTNAYFNSYWLPTCLPSFISGMLAFRIYSNLDMNRSLSIILVLFSITSFFVLCLTPVYLKSILSAPILGVFLLSFGQLFKESSFPNFLTWVGKISYSAYFWHFIIILLISKKYSNTNLGFFTSFVIVTLFSIILASITYKYIEIPFLRLGQHVCMYEKNSTR